MKTVATLTAVTLLAFASWPSVYHKRIPLVVQIGVRTSPAGGVTGSGTILGRKGLVLTAAHVVNAKEEVYIQGEETATITPRYKVKTYDDQKYACTLVKMDVFRDLALLRCDGLVGINGVKGISDTPLVPGDSVAIIGQPLGFRNSITQGIVFQLQPEKGKNLFDITSGPGASGGPLFDAKGRLVGVVQFGLVGMFEPFGAILGGSNQDQLGKFLKGVKI